MIFHRCLKGLRLTLLQIWDTFEDHYLFDGDDPETNKYHYDYHHAEMVALLGPPQKEFLEKHNKADECFDEEGKSTAPDCGKIYVWCYCPC